MNKGTNVLGQTLVHLQEEKKITIKKIMIKD